MTVAESAVQAHKCSVCIIRTTVTDTRRRAGLSAIAEPIVKMRERTDETNSDFAKDGLRPASTWMPSSPGRHAVTLTFDLQNLIRSSVGASEYSLQVSLRLFKPFMR